jgi:hypothetical protein
MKKLKAWKAGIMCKIGRHKYDYFQLPGSKMDLVPGYSYVKRCEICKKTWYEHWWYGIGGLRVTKVDAVTDFEGLFRKLSEYKKMFPANYRFVFDAYIFSIWDEEGGDFNISINEI